MVVEQNRWFEKYLNIAYEKRFDAIDDIAVYEILRAEQWEAIIKEVVKDAERCKNGKEFTEILLTKYGIERPEPIKPPSRAELLKELNK